MSDVSVALSRRHLRFGWWSLLVFPSLGVVLESMHGPKVGWYLDVASAERRHRFTLAHAHGTLLSLVHIAFGLTLAAGAAWSENAWRLASRCLIGAVLLFAAVLLTARGQGPP